MPNKRWSDEVRQKMSESAKKAWSNPEIRKKRIKKHFRGKLPSGKRIIVKCNRCGKEFETLPYIGERSHYKRYCSKGCLGLKVKVKCAICNKEIERNPKRASKTGKFYCSVECRRVGRRKKVDVICECCGKKFVGVAFKGKISKFCSRSCADKGKITGSYVYCKRCGKRFWEFKSNPRTYCSEKCSQISHRSDYFDEDGMMRKNYGKTWAKNVKKRDKYSCKKCGSKKQITAHHILPWRDHPNQRFNINNGITLCRECHLKVHSGEITI